MASVAPPPRVSVLQAFRGKHVLVTGASGFLGKAVVEKLLRDVPDVACIYVLVRPRKGSTAEERMQKEIIESEIFTRLRSVLGQNGFQQLVKQKLHAIAGELTYTNCGISKKNLEHLYEHLDIVIHCAAVVDFNERLDRAIELNVMGAVRLLEIAQRCRKVNAFIHTSTCYVNCNRTNEFLIEEKVYELGFNPWDVIEKVRKMPVTELGKVTVTGLLHDWPNTYTFTKAMAENILTQKRGSMPLCIVRPSIIGGAWSEPVPGWTDVISAAGAVYMSVGLGVLKFLPGDPNNVADIIPVDTVVNALLAAVPNIMNQDRLMVCHAASSAEKPLRWALPIAIIPDFFKNHPPKRRLAPPEFTFLRSPQMYQIQFFLRYSVPSALVNTVAKFGSKSYKSKADQYSKLVWRVRVLIETFRHFVENQWQFLNRNTKQCWEALSPEEKKIFNLDLTDLDWHSYNLTYCFGLMRYVLKEDLVEIDEVDKLISLNDTRVPEANETNSLIRKIFPDVTWAYQNYQASQVYAKTQASRSPEAMRLTVLSSARVREAIREHAATHKLKVPDVEHEAKQIFEKLCGQTSLPVIAGMGVFLRKIWRRLYQNIHIDAEGLTMLRELSKKGPIVFVPTHRSYIDFLVISYICFSQNLPIPCIAAGEDFLGILLVRWLFRHSGAFFIRRSFSTDKLYTAIFSQYIEQLLVDGHSLEFFIEGTRSRSGKMLQPKTGLLSVIQNVFLDRKVPDLNIVPITINYEKTMEGDLYSNELLGEQKIKESLRNLLRSSSVLKVNFGSITVRFAEPISLKNFTQHHGQNLLPGLPTAVRSLATDVNETSQVAALAQSAQEKKDAAVFDPFHNKEQRRALTRSLAYRLVYELAINSECMPTHLVATLMLQYRQGVTREHLISRVEWLRREIMSRGGRVALVRGEDRHALVNNAISHLRHLIVERRTNVFEPNISERTLYRNMLVLGHYRNRIVHMFYREGLWALALYSFGEAVERGVDKAVLVQEVKFLASLLDREFIYKPHPDIEEDTEKAFQQMVDRGILKLNSNNLVEVARTGEVHFSFLCALFWPFVDSYYAASMILFSLQPNKSIDEARLLQRTQWLATTLYHDQMLSFYESCSNETLRNAFTVFEAWKVVKVQRKTTQTNPKDPKSIKNTLVVQLLPPYQEEDKLQELVDRINRFRKPPPVRKSNLRRHLIAEIPLLAKL